MPQVFQDYSYICIGAFLMNCQSRGNVRLQSSNTEAPLLCDPRVLEHPYDRRACIEICRYAMEVLRAPKFAKDTVSIVLAPSSDTDEDILDF